MKAVNLQEPSEVHWVEKYLFAREKMQQYKVLMDEAKEVWLGFAGEDWDVLTVRGKPTFEQHKTAPNRFSVTDLKKKYPEIYQELIKPVPQTAIKVME